MKRAWIAVLCAACGATATVAAPRPQPEQAQAVVEPPGFALTIEVSADALVVETIARGEGLESWSALPVFEDLVAEDARGSLQTQVASGVLTFDRAPEPPLRLRYRVPAHPERDEYAFGDVVRFDGRVLLLPSSDAPRELSISLEGVAPERIATTLGLGAHISRTARPIDLRDVTWAIGDQEHATFDARQGRDVVASVGGGSYDVRWVGAEIALMRTRVDGWFGGIDAEPHTTLLVVRPPMPGAPPVSAARSGIGLVVLIERDAPWNGEARLMVAQVLARRWLGGVLRFSSDGAEDTWASYGITRWIAQEILADMGTITIEERATDLTRLEGVIALAEPDDATVPIARGTLYAAAIDARLRAHDEVSGLRAIVLDLVAQAEDAHGAPLSREVFVSALRDRLGTDEPERFAAQLLGTAPIDLPAGAFGPCLRRGRALHRRFALGVTLEGELVSVVPGSPAYRAGLRDGMRVRDLRYAVGQPSVPAQITLIEEPPRTVEWLPFDREVRGVGWERTPRIPEERCGER